MNGQYEVVIVRYGTRQTVRSDVFLNYPLYGTPEAPIGMDYFFWVIRNSERTVLVDTGFSAAGGASRGRDTVVSPADAWETLGITAEQAPRIIVTHAHYDHTGNLDHFPGSRITMAAAEREFWRSGTSREILFHHSAEDAELEQIDLADSEGRLDLFHDRVEVAPGIEVLEVGGHTPGQSVVLVQTEDGPVLLASDAIHYYEEYEAHMPFVSVANLVDMYRSFDRIAAMIDAGVVTHLVSGHDPDTLTRFTPVDGPLQGNAATIGAYR